MLKTLNRIREIRVQVLTVSFISLIFISLAAYSQPQTMELNQVWIDRQSEILNITCYLDILDVQQQRVADILPTELSILIGGVALQVEEVVPFEETGEGVAYTVMLDVSGTMKGNPFAQAVKGVGQMIEHLRQQDFMSLYIFGDTVECLSDFTNDKAKLLAAFQGKEANANITALYKAIFQARKANQRIDSILPRRRAMVIMSDGKDEGSGITIDDLSNEMMRIEIPVFSMGFTKIDEIYLENMERLSTLTNGLYVRVQKEEDFPSQFERIQQVIMRPYRVSMHAPYKTPAGLTRIKVDVSRAERTITSERSLLVPDPPPPVEEGEEEAADGMVSLVILPLEAAQAGAKWRVGDGDWLSSGEISAPLEPGIYQIAFAGVGRWMTPQSQEVEIKAGETVSIESAAFVSQPLIHWIIDRCFYWAKMPIVYISLIGIALLLLLLLLLVIFVRNRQDKPNESETEWEDTLPVDTESKRILDTIENLPDSGNPMGTFPYRPPDVSTGILGGEVPQDVPRQPKVKVELVIIEGPDKDKRYRYNIGTPPLKIGRSPACELRLSDQAVSDLHCELSADGEHVYVTDKGSRNGTIVNGINARGKSMLRDKDTFALGTTHIRVLL